MTSPAETPCVFCEIIAGRAESSLVYEDEHVVAFMDIRPLTPGHVLVVPRRHADYLEALDEDLGAHVHGRAPAGAGAAPLQPAV
jgi:histidine triad (HIT) family protein